MTRYHPTLNMLVGAAALVIIFAAARLAQEIVLPFLLAVFISVIAAAPMAWLRDKGVPAPLAVAIVVVLVVAILLGVTFILAASVDRFSQTLPLYLGRLREMTDQASQWLAGFGLDMSKAGLREALDPGAAMRLANAILSGLGQLLSNAFLITLAVIFMLLEASAFSRKLQAISDDAGKTLARLGTLLENTKRYTAIKALTSLATGVLIAIGMAVLGVDYPLLWGFLAFLLNFIPTIGSIIAAVPAVLITLLQLGIGSALAVTGLFLAVNMVIGNFIEPRVMGRGVGLSTVVVFLSLIFWGWLLGPIGMLLSVPLTMMVKFGAEASEDTRWLATLLSPAVAVSPIGGSDDQEGES